MLSIRTRSATHGLPVLLGPLCVAGSLCAALTPAVAVAQCAFDQPFKAKSLRSVMTRAYTACSTSTLPMPNTVTTNGTPACTPPQPSSSFEFDDVSGSCRLKISQKGRADCSGQGACASLKVQLKCGGILDPGGTMPTNSPGWSLRIGARLTMDEGGTDMTIIDAPAQFSIEQASRGKLSVKIDTADPCGGLIGCLFGPNQPLLPPCSALQYLSFELLDPNGDAFAVLGTASSAP